MASTAINSNSNSNSNMVSTSSTALLNALIDVIKCLIPIYIVTSNTGVNFAIVTLIITVINYVISNFDKDLIFNKFKKESNNLIIVNESNEKLYLQYVNRPMNNISWDGTNVINYQIKFYLTKYLHYKITNFNIRVNAKGEEIIYPNDINDLISYLEFVKIGERFPIFLYNKQLICVGKNSNSSIIYFETNEVLEEFLTFISQYKKIDNENKHVNSDLIKITYHSRKESDNEYIVYPDRTFSKIISRHKQMILNQVKNFIQVNESDVSFYNGQGTYNLGILLYGEPGCGKTLLTKALANELKRNIVMVNMSMIKTASQFRNLFYGETGNIVKPDYKNIIYVLEEFDCVDSILSRENSDNTKSKNVKDILTELMDKRISLSKSITAENKESVTKEVEHINNEIHEYNDKLNMNTLLTTLDGSNEMRGRVMIATTNRLDQIDKAIIRPGRFDIVIELKKFISDEIKEYLNTVTNDEFKNIIDCENFPDYKYSPAELCQKLPQFSDKNNKITKDLLIKLIEDIKNE